MYGQLMKKARYALAQYLLTFCLLLVASASSSTETSWEVVAEPDWGSQARLNPTAGKGVSGGKFYNLVERHHRYGSAAESKINYVRYIYTIINAAGLDSSAHISIDFDPLYESVQLHKVIIHRGDTEIDQINTNNIQLLQREKELDQGLYNGELTLHMLLADQRVGDRIEVSYSVIGANPVFNNHIFGWARLQSSVPVGNSFFNLSYPSSMQITTRTYAGELEPSKKNADGLTHLTWENYNATAQKYQSDTPASYSAQTEIQYSEFNSWSDVANWAEPLYKLQPTSDELKAFAATIKNQHDNLEDQVSAVITFVQDDVRYTGINSGIGGYKPDNPTDILRRRFGDCKDKAVLMAAILNELGVTAHPVLVHSRSGKGIAGYLPTPDAFNHMIVHLPDHNNQSYWIDGTISLQGSSPDTLYQGNYHHALIPAQSEKGLVAYQIAVPSLPEKEISEAYTLKYNHESEPTKLKVTSTFRGYEAEYLRRTIHNSSIYSLQENYLEFYQSFYENIQRIGDFEISDDRKANTITIEEHYEIQDALEYLEDESDNDYATFSFSVYAETITGDLSVPSDTRRKQPLAQYHPVYVSHNISLTHADGWSIEDDTFDIKNSHLEFKSSNTKKGANELVLEYELKTLTDTVSVKDSKKYIADLKQILDSPYYGVTFSVSREEMNYTKFDKQLVLIGDWFRQNLDQLGTQSSALNH